MTDTIDLPDGTELQVAEDATDARTVVTGATVSRSQKENLGNYENVEPYASLSVEFRPAIPLEATDAHATIRARLEHVADILGEHIQAEIETAVDQTTGGPEVNRGP